MADYGAFSGALMLAQQLSIDRFMDSLEKNRNHSMLAADFAVLRQRYSDLVRQFNGLTQDFNKLYCLALESEAERKNSASLIKELMEENSQRAADFEKMQLNYMDAATELALLRKRDRRQNPDLYRFSDD